jgi:hypothetical protein
MKPLSGYPLDESHMIEHIRHYLPSQNPLKDFVHHNTLHAFQHKNFHIALSEASQIFGYKVYLQLHEYRKLYKEGKINPTILTKVITLRKGQKQVPLWSEKVLNHKYSIHLSPRVGTLRKQWKKILKRNPDKIIHPQLFASISNYLDQGISQQHFPEHIQSFLESVKYVHEKSYIPIFQSKRVQSLLSNIQNLNIIDLLKILVGDEIWFEKYLFDQQFNHPGWSGMVSVLEKNPQFLLDKRTISLREFILLELLLEIDFLDLHYQNTKWKPLSYHLPENFVYDLFENIERAEIFEVLAIWQEAFEFSYYEQIFNGILQSCENIKRDSEPIKFQVIFCIDDRSCSIRRHIERINPEFETYGTAGHFNLDFYFLPHGAKFYSKSCPPPLQPKFLIKECEPTQHHEQHLHLKKNTVSLLGGAITSPTVGVFTIWNLVKSIFFPSETAICISSSKYMDANVPLSIENQNLEDKIDGLQVGYTVPEMAQRMCELLKSIGLTKNFGKIVYLIGHGASSVNNSYYAGYDCGACSGRPGSINARVASFMLNHPKVREILRSYDIFIPEDTQFIGGLQDTTKDTIEFFDTHILSNENAQLHQKNLLIFEQALDYNALERSRRFDNISHQGNLKDLHKRIQKRAWTLFEPRPEYNHATNAACFIGNRKLTEKIFLDRRVFLNSYDYQQDLEGFYLVKILNAITPVCGGINLEYYFSRMDPHKLGAGSKLPHNVMGLLGVANGTYGDLRTGLPTQMTEIHDPLRLCMIIEHLPDIVMKILHQYPVTAEWFINEWIHLFVFHPYEKKFYHFLNSSFIPYEVTHLPFVTLEDAEKLFRNNLENLPVSKFN